MDPLSITASAAGLVSLGLTVSGGLIRYCKAYKSQDTDLAQLAQHAQELEEFLNLVGDRTSGQRKPRADIDGLLQNCRDACDTCLLDFKLVSSKYIRLKSSKGLKERSRRLVQHLKYPFDKENFDALRSKLQEFKNALLGHLQLINLDLTQGLRSEVISESTKIKHAVESMGMQLHSSISSIESAVTGSIRSGVDRLESSIQRRVVETEQNITTSLDGNLSVISSQVASLGETQNNQALLLRNHLDQAFELQLKQLQAVFNQTHERGIAFRNRLDSIEEGAASTTHTHWDQRLTRKTSSQASVSNIFDSLCNCPRVRRRVSTVQHRKGCIYSFGNRKERTFTASFRVFKGQITARWKLEYSELAWWRNWQIHPNLTCRAVVPPDTPAFSAMGRLRNSVAPCGLTTRDIEESCRNCLIELQQIFASGKGWPTDISPYGETLLHRACFVCYRFRTPEQIVVANQFISNLMQMGVPVNEPSIQGSTPLAILLTLASSYQYYSTTTRLLVNTFINIEASILNQPFHSLALILEWNIPELYEPLSWNELCHAVLHRDEYRVVRLLRNGCSVLVERSTWGRTILHLASNWPRGLSILIEYAGEAIQPIIDGVDYLGHTALTYATELQNIDSVKLLLNAGAGVTSARIYFQPRFYSFKVVKDVQKYNKIGCILVECLAQRRRDLLRLALLHLPTKIIDKFGLRGDEDKPLDSKAFDVAEALRQQGIPIPSIHGDIVPGSVYCWPQLTLSIARKLFDAGFHETNAAFRGYYPLMANDYYQTNLTIVSWFEDHGADLYQPIPIPNGRFDASDPNESRPVYPAIHGCMAKIGYWVWDDGEELSQEEEHQLSRLLEDKISDPCVCYCTKRDHGCTSASVYIREPSLSLKAKFAYRERWCDEFGKYVTHLKLIECVLSERNRDRVAMDIIRMATFTALGMGHTCCDYNLFFDPSPGNGQRNEFLILKDPEEIEEIREEDRYLAELLETLMDEFEAKYRALDVSLSDFMRDCWYSRMLEVLEERDELSADELHTIGEIGIVLDDA